MNIKIRGEKNDEARIRQERVQNTFLKIYNGETSDLKCPYCSSHPLRFSYTFVEPDIYGIWISCTFCDKEAHLRLTGRPPGYNKKYVLREFQERDEQAVKLGEEWWRSVSGKGKT